MQLKSQVPSNVTKPYSETNNIKIDFSNIESIDLNEPTTAIEKAYGKDIYAIDIKTDVNIIEKGTVYELTNSKILKVFKVKAEGAKSINLTFNNFYLSKNSKMFIYSLDKKQVMGPITRNNNNKIFNTHIILTDEVVIEILSDNYVNDIINLTNLAYGIKDVNYFININEETYSNYKIHSTGCLQSMLDTKHHCNYLGLSSGVNMKQANCSDFDDLEKAKRALCVIISHNSEDDPPSWEAKGGILINTASLVHPNQAENYCNNYVLTCAHCLTGYWGETYPYVDPTNIVVRFNWLRKECEIPIIMPNCDSVKTAWEDLINYDEVIDYCDVELLERDSTHTSYASVIPEYAILKINEPLRFKEYYNGWKIYEYFTLENRESTIMGQWGGNPIEGKIINAYSGGSLKDVTWNLVDTLGSGHSGTTIFEQKYITGIINNKKSATSLGTLYIDDLLTWKNTTPRNILDPDGIYATNFDNGDSIIVEGVERWEKSDCLISTVNCNPSLDLTDYLTSIEDSDCCFKLEYIDSFIGGVPYGIRIYRDNETQNTLYYDFGSEIFAGSDSAYNNPINGNIIEFCIDPEELAADGGKIVIEFLDNNGKIICRKVVELDCPVCCSDARLQIDLLSEEPTPSCCALIIMTVDTSLTPQCVYSFANIYDNIDSTFITSQEIITFQDSLLSFPMFLCNYDTIPKQFLIEFYSTDSTIGCSKLTNQFLPPCEVMGMVESTSKNKEKFDITTKSVKSDEIIFEYLINNDEKIKIELFNKYNISLGVIQNKDSKKGANEFKLNIEKLKSGIYIFKMNGKENSIIRRLIIE